MTGPANIPKPPGNTLPPLSPADLRASGLNLLLLTAQAYYKMLENVLRSPCQALDLDLNQHYLWTVSTIEALLKNNPELHDFPGKFEPLVPDLYPSTVLDYDWEDFAAPKVEGFLADVQKYVFGKGHTAELTQGSPAWIFVELFRPNVTVSIEKADAYYERMQQHLRQMLKKAKPPAPAPAADPAGKEPARQPAPAAQTHARPVMPFNTTAFRVMIASPSDVPEERAIVREVLNDWNDQHSEQRSVVLLPVGWETHSVPTLGDRPQSIINKQVLKNADALVGVFWTRIGTHTGVDISGTVEEIREHVALGKPAMIYFSSRPVPPDKLDPEQFKKVQAFKKECKGWGLIETYKDHDDFRQKLARHINRLVSMLLEGKPVQPPASAPVPAPEFSAESKALLAEAVQDRDGCILYAPTHDGADLDTNGKSLIPPGNPRKRAAMLAALKQLRELEYLEDESGKGEVYMVTAAGYAAADKLGFKRVDPPELE